MAVLWLHYGCVRWANHKRIACLLLLPLLRRPREDKLICSSRTSSSLLASPLTHCLPWIRPTVHTVRNGKDNHHSRNWASQAGSSVVKKESTCWAGNVGLIPGSGRSQAPQHPWTTWQLSSLGSFSLTSPRPVAGEARDPEMSRNTETQPTPEFVPGKSHRQRGMAEYNPWGCKRVGHDLVTKQQQ